MVTIPFKRLSPLATLPVKATNGSACVDLCVAWVEEDQLGWTVHTDLAVALPPGYGMLIYPRSGLSTKWGLTLRNTVGVIDSDYRGEIILKFGKGHRDYALEVRSSMAEGVRIAQAMIIQVPDTEIVEAEALNETDRGAGGFGSTGA
jgi:dUTP pyrophosphatase